MPHSIILYTLLSMAAPTFTDDAPRLDAAASLPTSIRLSFRPTDSAPSTDAVAIADLESIPREVRAWMPDQPTDTPPPAPAPDADSVELAKKLSNPVASLISVPFQFNYDTGFGPKDAGKFVLNVQPVIPFSLGDDWNLITRTIVPLIFRESPANGIDDETGLGDTTQSFFFSPKKGDLVWGVGPAFLWPTATSNDLGSRQWAAGPTGLVLKQFDGWTVGILANHLWSYAGETDRSDVNATFLQPFISHTWPTATTLGFNTETTYDWTAQEWTVPLNLFASQLVKFGKQPVQFTLGGRYYAASPEGGPEWGVRFVVTFLFPTN